MKVLPKRSKCSFITGWAYKSIMKLNYHWNTHCCAILLLLDKREHAGEDAGTHDQVSLLLHVSLEDSEDHW